MGSRLRFQLIFFTVVAWVAAGLADRRGLPYVEVVCAIAAIAAGLLTLLPER